MKKPSKLEMARRYARVVDLLGLHSESVAVSKAAAEFGVKTHQIRNHYLPHAREVISVDIGKSRRLLSREHHHRLNTLFSRAEKIGDKLAALAQIAALHGLNAPTQVAVTVDVLYNPEDQLRAMADPAMLDKILALDAEFEQARLSHGTNGDGDPGKLPHGPDVDAGTPGVSGDSGLPVSGPPPTSPEGTSGDAPPPG
jgi:hypothetical protein